VTLDPSQYRYSITIETRDDAVLFCLRALWQYAEQHPSPYESLDLRSTSELASDNGQTTFRFSTANNRSDFLGEATRLLAGKWTRLGTSDDDPPDT
jgi:hypothetical protein